MTSESRMGIYEYLGGLFASVTDNVYLMNEPQELTDDDATNGFIVVRVGDFVDAGEFRSSTYNYARAFIECYVPPISRGRLDVAKYKQVEKDVNDIINQATVSDEDSIYWIDEDSIISIDDIDERNANNAYYMFVKSFVVIVDGEEQEEEPSNNNQEAGDNQSDNNQDNVEQNGN